MAAWNATRDLIQPQLRLLRNIHPELRFVLVGHSLGGAVAGLAGLEMRNAGQWGDVEVVTFGNQCGEIETRPHLLIGYSDVKIGKRTLRIVDIEGLLIIETQYRTYHQPTGVGPLTAPRS